MTLLLKEKNKLVIIFDERPTIVDIDFEGLEDIDDEQLEKILDLQILLLEEFMIVRY